MTDTILIVDDSSFIVEGLNAILKKSYRTLAVYGGQQCLDLLKSEKPSIIILDIMMEPMDGWETLTHIKKNPDTRHIPVLMFSAKKISVEEAEEHRISINDFITKPVTPKKLIETIEKVLTRQKENCQNVELWRSAGISKDLIDNCTSLMTSLEVDMSLLQNMKVQHSLVHGEDDTIRRDLEAVIVAIEKRIHDGHLQETKLYREMQDLIAENAKEKKHIDHVPVTERKGLENLAETQRTNGASQPELPDAKMIFLEKINPVVAENLISGRDETLERTVLEIPIGPDVTLTYNGITDTAGINNNSGPDSPVEVSAVHPFPDEELKLNNPTKSPAKEPGHDPDISDNSTPSKMTGKPLLNHTQTKDEPLEMPIKMIAVPDDEKKHTVPEQKHTYIAETRPISARTLDNIPLDSGTPIAPAIGSGTDILAGRTPYKVSGSERDLRQVTREKNKSQNEKSSPQISFISRIISKITGFFKRKG